MEEDDDIFLYGEAHSSPQAGAETEPVKLDIQDQVDFSDDKPSEKEEPSVFVSLEEGLEETPKEITPVVENVEPQVSVPIESFEQKAAPETLPQLEESENGDYSESDDESIDIILEMPPEGEAAGDTGREGLVHLRVAGEGRVPTKANENKVPGLDLDAIAYYDGESLFDIQLEDLDEKPWRKPGADLTDYFNYGFEEHSWSVYCQRQQKLREANAIGSGAAPLRSYGGGRLSPRRYDSSFKRPLAQSGSIQIVAGSERERDNSTGDNEERHHSRHGGRGSQHSRVLNEFSGPTQFQMGMFPKQSAIPSTLPPLSYSLNGLSMQARGSSSNLPPGFNPVSNRNLTGSSSRSQNRRGRSQSPNHSDNSPHRHSERSRDHRSRSKKQASRSPSRGTSPPHRQSKSSSSRRLSKSPTHEKTRDSSRTRERRHSHRDDDDSSTRKKESAPPRIKDKEKERERDREKEKHKERPKEREQEEKRRDKKEDKEKSKDKEQRTSSRPTTSSSHPKELKDWFDQSATIKGSRSKDKDKDRDSEKTREKERLSSNSGSHSTKTASVSIKEESKRSIKDRLGSKPDPEEASSGRKRSLKIKEEPSRKRHH